MGAGLGTLCLMESFLLPWISHICPSFARADIPSGTPSELISCPSINPRLTPKVQVKSACYSAVMASQKGTTLPAFGSLMVNAGFGFDECSLCGDSCQSSTLNRIELPCIDDQCEPCATIWRILSSPICPACYADFTCPKTVRDRTQMYSPQLNLESDDTVQLQSPLHSQKVSTSSFQSRYDAFYGADADSDNNTISDPGTPMREEEDGISTLGRFSNDELREAFILANNIAGTNFNVQELEDKVPQAILRTGTQIQLADALTKICTQKASENNEDHPTDEGSQLPDEEDRNTTWDNSFRCSYCQKDFRSEGHLYQHIIVHTLERRTCEFCGQVLATPASRRTHEWRHRETETEREGRLRKRRVAK